MSTATATAAKHANHLLLERLFTALDRHDHATMAACYHPKATFRDIAFELFDRRQIHSMWHMICEGDIRTTFEIIHANDLDAQVKLIDVYSFGATRGSAGSVPPTAGRRVRNAIDSRFRFHDGLIIEQIDACDPRLWASMALGGLSGFLAGRLEFLRKHKARKKLEAFVRTHPHYR